jgi:hypothetical protein
VFASKVPDHRGLALAGDLTVELKGADIVLQRSGPGLSMKIQAKDCATGGIFHGTAVACQGANADGAVTVTARVNFANDVSRSFVGRDSRRSPLRS